MSFKEITIGTGSSCDAATDKPCHDFAKDPGMILRLRLPCRFFDAKMPKGFA